MIETKTIWGKKYVKCYWPNSVRYEDIDWDWQKMYWNIYINDERVETAPLQATEEDARTRLLDFCVENWVEEQQRERKPID